MEARLTENLLFDLILTSNGFLLEGTPTPAISVILENWALT